MMIELAKINTVKKGLKQAPTEALNRLLDNMEKFIINYDGMYYQIIDKEVTSI